MKGNVDYVKALVALKTPALLLRDVNGFTPFHLAVKLGYSKVASLLAEASPPEVLYMETVVGATALETAVHCDLLVRARARLDGKCRPNSINSRSDSVDSGNPPAESQQLGEKAEALKTTISQLQKERRLTNGTKVTKALVAFADNMMTKAAEMKVKEVELEQEERDEGAKSDKTKVLEKDKCDLEKTLQVRRAFVPCKYMHHPLATKWFVPWSFLNFLDEGYYIGWRVLVLRLRCVLMVFFLLLSPFSFLDLVFVPCFVNFIIYQSWSLFF